MSASTSSTADTSSDEHCPSMRPLTSVSTMTTDGGMDSMEEAETISKIEPQGMQYELATEEDNNAIDVSSTKAALSSEIAETSLDPSSKIDDAPEQGADLSSTQFESAHDPGPGSIDTALEQGLTGTASGPAGPDSLPAMSLDRTGLPPAFETSDTVSLRLQISDEARDRENAEVLAGPITLDTKRAQSGLRLLQYQQYIGHVEDRMRILENEVEEVKKKQSAQPVESPEEKIQREASKTEALPRPELVCECYEAKNCEEFNDAELLGKYVATILPERAEEFMQTSTKQEIAVTTGGRVSRLCIQSPIIGAFLTKLLPKEADFGLLSPIIIRPFKPICLYEAKIRSHLLALAEEIDRRETTTDVKTETEPKTPEVVGVGAGEGIDADPYFQHSAQLDPEPSSNAEGSLTDKSMESLKRERQHFEVLEKLMDNQLKSELEQHRLLREESPTEVTFEHLWHLFYPGQIVYAESGNKQGYIVLNVRGGRRRFKPPVLDTTPYKDPYYSDPYAYKDPYRDPVYRSSYDRPLPPDDDARKIAAAKAYKIDNRNYTTFSLDCICIEYDGNEYGYVKFTSDIDYFKDEKSITELPLVPARLGKVVNGKTRLDLLKETGAKFEALVSEKVAHRDYTGTSLPETDAKGATGSREQIDSQVIIDFEHAYLKEERKPKFSFPTFPDPEDGELPESLNVKTLGRCPIPTCTSPACPYNNTSCFDDRKIDRAFRQEFMDKKLHQDSSTDAWSEMRNSVLPGYVYAYVLRNLSWFKLDLDLIKEPRPTTNFNDLVLPEQNRRLVKALVSSRRTASTSRTERVDLVRGKGQGVIVLLHGVPGTGKSSTAECVAEELRCPLFTITCGDIGVSPSEVSEALREMFYMGHKWNCVMLLDEADVFLQERDEKDLQRNAVVSVFLRALEYYSGVLFLTTNRVGKFDEAFVSRIHMSIYYPALDEDTTVAIWKVNLRKTKESKRHIEVDEDKLLRYARRLWNKQFDSDLRIPWNGRQIRNAFQSAIALSEFDYAADKEAALGSRNPLDAIKAVLSYKHFGQVADISADFDQYLKNVHAGDPFDMAARHQARHDDRPAPQTRYDTPRTGNRSNPYGGQRSSRAGNLHKSRATTNSDSDRFQNDTSRAAPSRFRTKHDMPPLSSPQPAQDMHSDSFDSDDQAYRSPLKRRGC